ncbi:MAG: hypothetical protein Q7T11_01125, partial [Deltaproteobacteria bacterium]|nr:hypothetical protein [Deltaproteobacteria bacterium]
MENAQFALDNDDFDTAIEDGEDLLADEPNNVAAARIVASAYFARSGISYFDLAKTILDLGDTDQFLTMAGALPDDADMGDLRSAIATLEGLSNVDDDPIEEDALGTAVFELALMQVVEYFAIGVFEADFHGTLDVTLITDEDATNAMDSMLD